MLWWLAVLAVCATAQGRAVNISNTWVLPEEGFPVFYRYFRDRISWYEADAVCQFHHGNLVTVDTTAQYDAVRAYLKELDISSAVWVGLIRSNPDGEFTWADYRGLSGDGYWSSAPNSRDAPLCAAADPAADYRWEARSCGGPNVASFICELSVPQWATGDEGCMIRSFPVLTILYLPESAAVQLTADCGLAGVKKVQCTGNRKREELLNELSCAVYTDEETLNMSTTNWTTQSSVTESDTTIDLKTTQENIITNNANNEDTTVAVESTQSPITTINTLTTNNNEIEYKAPLLERNSLISVPLNRDMNLMDIHNNNLQSNDIPKIINEDKIFINEKFNKMEDEQVMQHKQLHDELTRRENFDNIFTQPADHFVPPLVMAKAKLSDDMTVMSLEEKYAQQIAEHRITEKKLYNGEGSTSNYNPIEPSSHGDYETTESNVDTTTNLDTTISPKNVHSDSVKDGMATKPSKYGSPKKYTLKAYELKSKIGKLKETIEKVGNNFMGTSTPVTSLPADVPNKIENITEKGNDDPAIDLKVIINESAQTELQPTVQYKSSDNASLISNQHVSKVTEMLTTKNPIAEDNVNSISTKHEMVTITVLGEQTSFPIKFEFTTKMPIMETKQTETNYSTAHSSTTPNIKDMESVSTIVPNVTTQDNLKVTWLQNHIKIDATETTKAPIFTTHDLITGVSKLTTYKTNIKNEMNTTQPAEVTTAGTPHVSIEVNTSEKTNTQNINNETHATTIQSIEASRTTNHEFNISEADTEQNFTEIVDTEETIDDFQSPLLSGANEPLHKPNRSRRPQPQPNRNKFNPFRILG